MDDQLNQAKAAKNKPYILLVVIIVLTLFLVALKFILPANKNNNAIVSPSVVPEISALPESPDGSKADNQVKEGAWKTYKNNIFGLQFDYQESWGYPHTVPMDEITRLANVGEDFKIQKMYYDNSLDIVFSVSDQLRMKIFNDQYTGKSQSGIDEPSVYDRSGVTSDIASLKKRGDICDYNIGYKYNSSSLNTIYSNCVNGIKTVLTQNKQVSESGAYETLYSYDLKFLAFEKLQNGYFDNALVLFNVGSITQIKDSSLSLEGFLEMKGLKNSFEANRDIFATFSQSMKSFVPPTPQPKVFQIKEGENPDITVIRQYYFYLESGKLDDAYKMISATKTSIDQFKEWYVNTYSAVPGEFTEKSPHQYRFFVDYQDNNQPIEKYRVEMKVSNGKIIPIFSEKMKSDIIVFGNMSAFSMEQNAHSYMVFSQDGVEKTIDEIEAFSVFPNNVGMIGDFLNPKFSPLGNYLTYYLAGYEGAATRIYDIKNKIVRSEYFSSEAFGFTDDEKYFYECESNDFSGELFGRVLGLPDFDVKYELPLKAEKLNYGIGINCEYDADKKVIRFTISNAETSKSRIVEYSIITHKIENR